MPFRKEDETVVEKPKTFRQAGEKVVPKGEKKPSLASDVGQAIVSRAPKTTKNVASVLTSANDFLLNPSWEGAGKVVGAGVNALSKFGQDAPIEAPAAAVRAVGNVLGGQGEAGTVNALTGARGFEQVTIRKGADGKPYYTTPDDNTPRPVQFDKRGKMILPRVKRSDASERLASQDLTENVLNAGLITAGGGRGKTVTTVEKPAGAIKRVANKVTGGKLIPADQAARETVAAAIRKDGGTAEQVQAILTEWQKTGASTPSLVDIAAKLPNGGQNTLSVVRGAALKSPEARGVATAYRRGVEGNVQDRAINLTQRLDPDMRSTQQFVDDATALRSANASENYAPAYAEMVQVDDTLRSALSDDVGREILANARYAAQTQRDANKVAEIDGLLSGQAQEVSAGTLDELYQAFRDAGDARMTNPSSTIYNRRAGLGMRSRAGDIDATLEQVPALQPARADYGNLSANIEATDIGGGIMRLTPDEFAYQAAQNQDRLRAVGDVPVEMAQEANRQALRVSGRNALREAIGRPAEGATGVLNRISTSENIGQNVRSVFDEAADPYRQGIGNEVLRVQTGRAIDPNTGSQTAIRAEDAGVNPYALVEGAVNLKTGGLSGLIKSGLRAIEEGTQLTNAERQAIIELVTRDADLSALAPRTRTTTTNALLPGPYLPIGSGNGATSSALSGPIYAQPIAAEEERGRDRPR